MSRVGIQIGASTSPSDMAMVAQRAEALGYVEIWVAENYFELGGVASAALALGATENIPVGLGVVAAAVRHPAVTAMEYATLGGAYPGRFIGGLGHGAPGWLRQMGHTPASPLGLLREATDLIRRLLDGETVTFDGTYFQLNGASLDQPPPGRIPLYFGVQGPASLRMSGELADGTLLGWFSSPSSVGWANARIEEGRVRGETQGHHEVVALCLLSVSAEDPEAAYQAANQWATPMLVGMTGAPSMEMSAAGQELAAFVASVGVDAARERIPNKLLRNFMAVGSPEDCATTVGHLLDAGADRVILVPNPAGVRSTPEMIEQMELAVEVLDATG